MEENGEVSHGLRASESGEKEEIRDPQELAVAASQKTAKDGKGRSEKRGKRKLAAAGSPIVPRKPRSKEPATPVVDRPARERKSIDRFADSIEREKEKPKEVKIEQGSGAYLRDIPNVVFKLSKLKTSDELVQLLHRILYSKRGKPYQVKANILQFSGFAWGSNEEKEKIRIREKLEKIVKESLFQLSDLLDLSLPKTTKKEEVVLRVMEFLESPHKTTETLVQEQMQRQKEKKREKSTKGKRKRLSTSQTPQKRQRKSIGEKAQEDEAHVEPEEEQPEDVPAKKKARKTKKEPSRDVKSSSAVKAKKKSSKFSAAEDNVKEEPEEQAQEAVAEHEEDDKQPSRKRPRNKKNEDDVASKSPKKGSRKPVKTKSIYEPGEKLDNDAKDVKSKPLSKISKKEEVKEPETTVASISKGKKKATTGSTKAPLKKKKMENNEDTSKANTKKKMEATQSASKKETEAPPIPRDEDLRSAICELLHDADFSTVTFTDVVKQLGAKFNVDLSQKKAHVKNLIQEEISKIVAEEDGDGDNEEEETGVTTPDRKEKEPIEAATED